MWPFASKADVHKEIEAAQQSLITQIRQIIPQQTIAPPPTPPVQDFVLYNKLDQFQRQLDSLIDTSPSKERGILPSITQLAHQHCC